MTTDDVFLTMLMILSLFHQSAGLSSSSALVCCSGLATLHANGLKLSKVCTIN